MLTSFKLFFKVLILSNGFLKLDLLGTISMGSCTVDISSKAASFATSKIASTFMTIHSFIDLFEKLNIRPVGFVFAYRAR